MNWSQRHRIAYILVLLASQAPLGWAQGEGAPAAPPEALVFQLTGPRPPKNLKGVLPEGWDEERLKRADGLFYGGERVTLRRLVEIALANPEPKDLLIIAEPEARFARLRAVMQGFKNSEFKGRRLLFSTTRKPRQRHELKFFRSPFSNFVFSNGNVVFSESEDSEDDFSGDEEPGDADLPEAERLKKQQERHMRRRLELGIGPIFWERDRARENAKPVSPEEELKSFREKISATKTRESRVYLRLRIDNELVAGRLQEFFEVATSENADSIQLADEQDGYSQFLRAFGFGRLGDPVWLPRVVDNALKALARSQRGHGNWSAPPSSELDDLGTTALAMLAFLGEFHSPDDGTYKREVGQAYKYIVGQQRQSGALAGASEGFSFSHVLATYALIETYGLTGDDDHGTAAGRALAFMIRARNEAGLWGLNANDPEPDLLVSCWALVALSAAEDAGLEIPEGLVAPIIAWLDKLTPKESGQPRSADRKLTQLRGVVDEFYGRHAESLTAVSALMRSRSGAEPPEDERLTAALTKITSSPPDQGTSMGPVDLDYLYFGALLMNVHGGGYWAQWHLGLEDAVQSHFQRLQGQAQGIRGLLDADPAVVALLTSCLELSYRYSRNPASQR